MNEIFSPHNLHLRSLVAFEDHDPQLSRLRRLPYQYISELVARISSLAPGIYTLSGGRQVGKSTLVKQVMLRLLEQGGVPPGNILYMTGEVIADYVALLKHLEEFLASPDVDTGQKTFVAVDEVTYIHEWHRAVKFLADAGKLERTVLLLTDSDMVFLKELAMRLPGRRGREEVVDFHFHPLSFLDYVRLRNRVSPEIVDLIRADAGARIPSAAVEGLFAETEAYVQTGGYLTALSDYASTGAVSIATSRTYADWARGDMLKRGKNESYLNELLKAILRKYGSQVTWNSFTGDVSILHHQTIAEYRLALEAMDVLYIQQALREDRLEAAPKKAKKLHFTDPFICRALAAYAGEDAPSAAWIVEAAVVCHANRRFPAYFIKNDGEIDCAYVRDGRFHPIEVKWTRSVKPEHLVMLRRYREGTLAAMVDREVEIDGIRVVPLPFVLVRLS
jgi:predicted AAA+ superfamily ATPase